MIILKRDEVITGLTLKLSQLSNDKLVELYEQLYKVPLTISEIVDEQYIEEAIWDEMHVTFNVEIIGDEVEIIPDSFEELADYWGIVLWSDEFHDLWSDEFHDKLEALETKWSAEVGRIVKPK